MCRAVGGGVDGAPDSSAASEPRSLRKFYRFKVGAPIEVMTEAKVRGGGTHNTKF